MLKEHLPGEAFSFSINTFIQFIHMKQKQNLSGDLIQMSEFLKMVPLPDLISLTITQEKTPEL